MRTKRKFLVGILACLVAFCSLGLIACGGGQCQHEYGDWSVTTQATCTETGVKERTCSKCNNKDYGTVDSLGHDWVDATCTTPKTCNRCSATEGGTASHAYDQEVVKAEALKTGATCTSPAIYFKSCTCGAISTNDADTFTSGSALPHTYDQEVVKTETLKSDATCTSPTIYFKSCSCGAISTKSVDTFTVGSALPHTYDREIANTETLKSEANCTSPAVYYKSCVCGDVSENEQETFTRGVANSHVYNQEIQNDDTLKTGATCTSPAIYRKSCECGAISTSVNDTFTVGDPIPHTYDQQVVKTEALKEGATCTSLAVYYKSCSCGAISTSVNDTFTSGTMLAHTYNQQVVKTEALKTGATCTSPAVYYLSCTCGDISTSDAHTFTDGDPIAHTYDQEVVKDGTLKSEATCTSPETHFKSCSCGAISTNDADTFTSGSALPHTYDQEDTTVAGALVSEATCTSPAIYYKSCSCGAISNVDTFTDGYPIAHTYDQEVVKTEALKSEADCENAAVYYKSCSCGAISSDANDTFTSGTANGHSHKETGSTAATCTLPATKTYKCACGNEYTDEVSPALGHDIKGVTPTEKLVEGCKYVRVYICKNNDCLAEIEGEHIYKHTYTASITKLATCSEDGEKTYTCSACSATKTEKIEKNETGHSWTLGTPSDGVRVDSCSLCGENRTVAVYTEDTTDSINTNDLKNTEIQVNNANISLSDGVIDSIGDKDVTIGASKFEGDERNDLGLDAEQLEQVGNNPIYNFTINDGTGNISQFGEENFVTITIPYTLDPNEDVDSIAVWFINGDGELESIKATYNNGSITFKTNHFSYYTVTKLKPAERCAVYGHNYVTQHVDGDCLKDEYDLLVCVRCHDKQIINLIAGDGHDYASVTTDATCTTNGSTVYTCNDCDHSYTVTINATGHNFEVEEEETSTCKTNGYKTYGCTKCDAEYTETYEKTAHSYGVGTVVDSTCEENGSVTYACTVCGHSYAVTTPATGHNYGVVDSKESTCTENGYTKYGCGNCGADYTVTYDKAPHAYNGMEVDPTCDTNGYTVYQCENCEYSYTGDIVAATGHDYVQSDWEWSDDKTTAKITFVCGNDNQHVIELDANVSIVVVNGTCSNYVKTTYTASVSFNGEIYTDVLTDVVGQEGHVFSEKLEYDADEHWVECACGEKGQVTSHVFENPIITTDPTCVEEGESTSYCVCGASHNDVVPATGEHIYQDGKCTMCGAEQMDGFYVSLLNSWKNINGFVITIKDFSLNIKEFDDSLTEQFELIGSIEQIDVVELMLYFADGDIQGAAIGSFNIFNGPIPNATARLDFKAVIQDGYIYLNATYGAGDVQDYANIKISLDSIMDSMFASMNSGAQGPSVAGVLTFIKETLVPTLDTVIEGNSAKANAILEDLFNMIFTIEKQADYSYVATLDYEKLLALNENLATKTVAEFVDYYFGNGAFDSVTEWFVGLLNLEVSNIPTYLESLGINSTELLAKINAFAISMGAPAEFDINAMLNDPSMAGVTLGMLMFESPDYLTNVNGVIEGLRAVSLYAMINPEGVEQIKQMVDGVIGMLAESFEISFTADETGMLTSISLNANNFMFDAGSMGGDSNGGAIEEVKPSTPSEGGSESSGSTSGGNVSGGESSGDVIEEVKPMTPSEDGESDGSISSTPTEDAKDEDLSSEESEESGDVNIKAFSLAEDSQTALEESISTLGTLTFKIDLIINGTINVTWGNIVDEINSKIVLPSADMFGGNANAQYYTTSGSVNYKGQVYSYSNAMGIYVVKTIYSNPVMVQYAPDCTGWIGYNVSFEQVAYQFAFAMIQVGDAPVMLLIDYVNGDVVEIIQTETGFTAVYEDGTEKDVVFDFNSQPSDGNAATRYSEIYFAVFENPEGISYGASQSISYYYNAQLGQFSISSNHAFKYTYELNGETCADGYTMHVTCENCNYYTMTTGSGCNINHGVTMDLSEYTSCGGTILVDRCNRCGRIAAVSNLENINCTIDSGSQENILDSEGNVIGVKYISTCSKCGLTFVSQQWVEQLSVCEYVEHQGVYIYNGETCILECDDKTNYSNHQWNTSYQLIGETCDDGYYVIRSCSICGDSEEYRTYGHDNERRQTSLEDYGLCGGYALEEYCAVCNTKFDSHIKDDGCNWQYVQETQDGYTEYVCSNCNATKLEYVAQTEKDEICMYSRTETYIYLVQGQEVYRYENSSNYVRHNYVYEFKLNGSTCNEGYTIIETCIDCGSSSQGTGNGHNTYTVFQSSGYGCCDEHKMHVSACPCGYYVYASYNASSFNHNEDSNTYYCDDCGLSFIEGTERTENGCYTVEYAVLVVNYMGNELYRLEKETTYANHSFTNVTVELDGMTKIISTCDKCDETKVSEVLSVDLEYHEGRYYFDYYFTPSESASYTITALSSGDTYVELYYASDLYKTIASNDDGGYGNRFALTYSLNAGETYVYRVRYLSTESGTIDFSITQGGSVASICKHNSQLEFSGLKQGSISCEDGAIVGAVCKTCGNALYIDEVETHSGLVKERINLSEYGACYGEFYYTACACGQENSLYLNACAYSYESNEYYDDENRLVYVEMRKCPDCGLRYDCSYYTVSDTENCTLTYYYTVTLTINDSLIAMREYVVTQVSHEIATSATLLNGEGSSCVDGALITYYCVNCDYEHAETVYSHEKFESQRIDLAELDCACGGYVSVYTCACEENGYVSMDHALCDWGYDGCDIWIENVITGGQYYIDGWNHYEYFCETRTCAVTDPENCAYKVRWANYWLKAEGECKAYQYETWQFGYNQETDTYLYEVTVRTGESRVYHDYDNTSDGNSTRYNCPDCGSYYYENYEYDDNGELLKYEKEIGNTLDDGNRKLFQYVEEYSFDDQGVRYCSREYQIEVYADDTESWHEKTIERRSYTANFGENGFEVISQYEDSNGRTVREEHAHVYYCGYQFDVYSYRQEDDYWYRNDYTYTFDGECLRTEKYSNVYGDNSTTTQNVCKFYDIVVIKDATCTQDGEECYQCVICGNRTESSVINPCDHAWVSGSELGYYCSVCGIENENGASGSVIMEDLTDAYGYGENYVVGYYAYNNVEFTNYVSIILEDGTEIILDGVRYLTIDGVRAFAFSKVEVEALASVQGYTDSSTYDVRFTFVPYGAESSFDYGMTFTDNVSSNAGSEGGVGDNGVVGDFTNGTM